MKQTKIHEYFLLLTVGLAIALQVIHLPDSRLLSDIRNLILMADSFVGLWLLISVIASWIVLGIGVVGLTLYFIRKQQMNRWLMIYILVKVYTATVDFPALLLNENYGLNIFSPSNEQFIGYLTMALVPIAAANYFLRQNFTAGLPANQIQGVEVTSKPVRWLHYTVDLLIILTFQ